MIVLDGSHGEGGGQIVRTAVSLAASTMRPVAIDRIRAGRPTPGLAAQHLTAIRAAAAVAGAGLAGDGLGSERLEFRPTKPPTAGTWRFDVAEAREGGSAGAATLVLQTLFPALLSAGGTSAVAVRGGTHVPWSPAWDYFEHVWLETLRRLGVDADSRLDAWGFYPAGGGEIRLDLRVPSKAGDAPLRPLRSCVRGPLVRVDGCAVAANLPSHIAQRMADRAGSLLNALGVPVSIKTARVRAVSPGAWIFLRGIYEHAVAGFGALGRRGKPAEAVAEDAVADLFDHYHGDGALDHHLADQILLPLSFASGVSEFTCADVTPHLETNAWVIEQFGAARIEIAREGTSSGRVRITPGPLFS